MFCIRRKNSRKTPRREFIKTDRATPTKLFNPSHASVVLITPGNGSNSYKQFTRVLTTNPASNFEGQLFVNNTYFFRICLKAAYVFVIFRETKIYMFFDVNFMFCHDLLSFHCFLNAKWL